MLIYNITPALPQPGRAPAGVRGPALGLGDAAGEKIAAVDDELGRAARGDVSLRPADAGGRLATLAARERAFRYSWAN